MKRSPIRRYTPLEQRKPMRQRRAKPRDRGELEDLEYLAFVRTLPCCVHHEMHRHFGGVQAHHGTEHRGLGQKASDRDTMPMCLGGHRDFHMGAGPFRGWTRDERRAWQAARIAETREAWDRQRAA